ncbi:MAG TPA: hypothetical protein VJZ26_06000 [Blastocatellia bacterium]|nr:hypothetical protein [Blastocatellia bacterium]
MKRRGVLLQAAILLALIPPASFGQKPASSSPDAAATVKAFYTFHFQHKCDFSLPGLKLRHRWLDDALYKLMMAELKKPVKQDEVPDLDGDPFTNSQDPPNSFRVGETKQDDNNASVVVFFLWKDKNKVVDQRRVEVKLTKLANAWKISNVISGKEEDDDLLRLLKRSGQG